MAEPTNNVTGQQNTSTQNTTVVPNPEYEKTFPYAGSMNRLNNYDYFEKLFFGQHFNAFNARVDHPDWQKQYAKLKYIVVNFAGLLSKVCADMLFSEPPRVSVEESVRPWFKAFMHENKFDIQNYESALQNSYLGDAVYKLRIGKRTPKGEPTVILEDVSPKVYFPYLNPDNIRANPNKVELAWIVYIGKDQYVRKEIHEPGLITNELWKLEKGKMTTQEPLSLLGDDAPPDTEDTKIDRMLVIHVKNMGVGSSYFGISDYNDLDTLFYSLNNRLTKTENILDKHADPILALPQGVLDDNGQVNRAKLGVFEVPPSLGGGAAQKPEYIVWNASLESSFKQMEKEIDFLFMVSEISPDVLGMGKGQSDSGRALKYKLLRTLAKVSRKRTYYDMGLKEVFITAQELALAHKVKIDGVAAPAKAVMPEIKWFDGIPVDESEQTEVEAKRLDAGLSTKADSLMRLDNLEEDEAKKKAEEIKKEQAVDMPQMTITDPKFGKTKTGQPTAVPKGGVNGKQ